MTGIPLSYLVILHKAAGGATPDGDDAATYDQQVGPLAIPVVADGSDQVLTGTPWTGNGRPGKCALSPDMVMLACYIGEDDTPAFEAIQAHAASR